MNQYTEILEKAAKQLGFPFEVKKSDKSEAAYLKIFTTESTDFYDALTVRLSEHEASTSKSMAYEVQLDCGFKFDFSSKYFATKWGIDSDGDFSETELEDELVFNNSEEMINYMANCLVKKLQSKLN